jgi:hypothetical protein
MAISGIEVPSQRSASQFISPEVLRTSLEIELGKAGHVFTKGQLNMRAPTFALNDDLNFINSSEGSDYENLSKSPSFETSPFLIEEKDLNGRSSSGANNIFAKTDHLYSGIVEERENLQNENDRLRKELEALKAELDSYKSMRSNKGLIRIISKIFFHN